MYGVPSNLDLTFLHNAELIQVCLGAHQVQFHFHPKGSLYVMGKWELSAEDGVLVGPRLASPPITALPVAPNSGEASNHDRGCRPAMDWAMVRGRRLAAHLR